MDADQIMELKAEFEALSVKERFDFWQNKLGFKYVEFMLLGTPFYSIDDDKELIAKLRGLRDFRITVEPILKEDEDEKFDLLELSEFNQLAIDEYMNFYRGTQPGFYTIPLEDRCEELERELSGVADKASLIRHQIDQINQEVSRVTGKVITLSQNDDYLPIFGKAYTGFYRYGQFDLSEKQYNIRQLISIKYGEGLALFRKHLESILANGDKPSTQDKRPEMKDSVLIAYYAGYFNDDYIQSLSGVKQAKVISMVIGYHNKNIEDFIREFRGKIANPDAEKYGVPDLNELVDRLKRIEGQFAQNGHGMITQRIRADIGTLSRAITKRVQK